MLITGLIADPSTDERALLIEQSRVKCPLPDIELAGWGKRAQRTFAYPLAPLEAAMDAMDRFVSRENIERYRKLANESANDRERLQILKLLAEEEAKFKVELRRGSDTPEG